jgi:aspartyl-tRNA(Asn)/glutamyl-tRNA(Gln) amidotransferase subunit A
MKKYIDSTLLEMHEALLKGETTPLELTKEALKRAKENGDNAFETIVEDAALKKASELTGVKVPEDNILFGIPFVAKDNFSTKGILTTASSEIMKDYVPVYDATVIKILNDSDAILIGKSTLDELAMGGTGTTGHKGTTFNPYDKKKEHLIGGSSCGSAVAVSDAIVPFALGSDTGDSIRKPASFAGLVGLKPTRGLISRYGLFPFACSLDHVGYFTRSVEDSAALLDVLAKHDEHDSTSTFKEKGKPYFSFLRDIKGKKFTIVDEILNSIDDREMKEKFSELEGYLVKKGAIVKHVSVDSDLLKAIYPAYIVISSAEATSNDANLDGIKFGPHYDADTYQNTMMKARTNGFSSLIKRRFVIGSYALMRENQEEVFKRAQKVRHLLVNRFNEIFLNSDTVILPAGPSVAPKIGTVSNKLSSEYLIADNRLAIGNFGGYPSITVPLGFEDGLPYGVNVTSKPFDEYQMFSFAHEIENFTGLRNVSARNYLDKGGK